ncbi:hypothetical protein [uncultured Microbacterium sp.]|uniref:hypothetical protein n=1 Tax=uncultured Microbacterium sp. TaxID=191216 RepID=UPI002639C7FF|nr:hypothetical protein [uncultured Microbacterium sp.]
MAARRSKTARTQNERARRYAARTAWHERQISRRVRDNTLAGIVAGIVILGAIASQSVHAAVTAPAPETTPAPGVSDTPLENPFIDLFTTGASAD